MTFRIAVLGAVAAALLAAVACEPWSPESRAVTFELRGAHQALPCEGCHPVSASDLADGTPEFTAEITVCGGTLQVGITTALQGCLDCHECDRKDDPDGHYYPTTCAEIGCHSDGDLTWADIGGGTGTVQFPGPCSGACHGDAWDDNSPRDTSHAAHLQGTTLRAEPFDCEECHPPDGLSAPTHDDGAIDLPFGGLTVLDPYLVPAYDAATKTCGGTYCHSVSQNEPGYVPTWNAGPTDAECGTCHAFPPDYADHPDSDFCDSCHLPTGGEGQVFETTATHIDGTCDGC